MATTVNSRFLAIGSGEPNINAGWTIRVLDYKDMKSLVAIVSEFTEFSFTQQLNDPGTGSITIDEDSPFWAQILNSGESHRALQNREYVFEAWDNNVPRFAWLAQAVNNVLIGEDETRAVELSGPGIAQVLTWAKVGRPAWPTAVPIVQTVPDPVYPNDATKVTKVYRAVSSSDMIPAFNWQFPLTWPTMRMWLTVLKAAQRRGAVPWVTPLFTALKDSARQDFLWVKVLEEVVTKKGYQPEERDEHLLDFLNDCTGQDYSKWFGQRLEWLMYPGFKLDVRRTIGSDRSKTVRFFGGNILSDERTRDREEIYNRVVATDVTSQESNRTDKASVATWNIREQWNTTNQNVTIKTMRDQLADKYIQQSKDEKDQWTIKIPYDDPGRVPYRNFYVGDYVGVNADYFGSTPTATAAPTKYRVMAITVSVTSDQTYPDCELTLKSIIDTKQEELQRQITDLINNPKYQNLSGLTDVDTSTSTGTSTLVFNPTTGKWEATSGTVGSGGGGNGRVFMQSVDPATQTGVTVTAGDFWLETYD